MQHHRFAKTLSISIPIFAFTILLPVFEHPTEAKNPGFVLGISTQQSNADFITPAKEIEPIQSSYGALDISAKSILAYDLNTGKILAERDSDQKLPIASLTKLMTSVVAMDDSAFIQPIKIESADHVSVSPVLNIRNGEEVMPIDLIKAMLVGSANDAAWTIGNHFSGRQAFVEKMNAKAAQLGMDNTHFDNPVGFDSANNYSTAADLQKLVDYALKTLPYSEIWQKVNYSFKTLSGATYSIKNSNDLVAENKNIHSIKTGYTPLAEENMIVQAENENGNSIVTIVLGTPDRNTNTKKVINYVFKSFEWK